ncbi:hypothetical protein BH23PLA1_BH23PLA1_16390 [soil metagenome]
MDPLRIVLVMNEPPLPFGDAAARWYYVLFRGLVERGHRVSAFAAFGDPARAEQAAQLFPAPDYDLRLFPHRNRSGWKEKLETLRRPYSYTFDLPFRQDLAEELARGFDLLHLESLWSGWVGREHAEKALLTIQFLYSIDLADAPVKTWRDRFLRFLTYRAERELLRQFPQISSLATRLNEAVRRLTPEARQHLVPLALDLGLYPFEPKGENRAEAPVVGLIGSFGWYPSFSAAERLITRLWPEIKRRVPTARLQIVGRSARKALGGLVSGLGPEVILAEDVPDIFPYFRALDVMLYTPIRGSGMKVKVMEAFALGVPVVTTAEGVEGLEAEDGVHAGISEEDDVLIERTVALLNDPNRAAEQARAARDLLERQCGPVPVLDRLEQVYAEILRPGRSLVELPSSAGLGGGASAT